MTKIQKIKMSLQRMLMAFGEVVTKEGTLEYAGEELAVGTEVFINDEPAPSGEYESEDKVIVVEDGKVAEIREKEVEEAPAEEQPVEEVKAEEEVPVEPEPEPSLEDSLAEILAPVIEKLNAVVADVEALKARLSEIESKLLEDSVAPADEQFQEVNKKSNFYRN